MANIKFQCHWCNGKELRQTRRFVTVSQRIEDVTPTSLTLNSDYDIHGGNAPNFECNTCGTALYINNKPITEIKDLFDTLQTFDMVETK